MAKVVLYNGKYYLWYKTNNAGKAQLITDTGDKFSGTPDPGKLKALKDIPTVKYNRHEYAVTKQGVFSCTTGNKVTDHNILELAQQHGYKIYYCVVCGKNSVDVLAGYDTCQDCINK